MAAESLFILGPGVLGQRVATRWRASKNANNIQAHVHAETRTESRHAFLSKLGISAQISGQSETKQHYSHVLLCAPPSQTDDYVADIEGAAQRWDGSGSLVFTSSAGVYSESNGLLDETAELSDDGTGSSRAASLVRAEKAVLAAGGTVVRFAGLYHSGRGAHSYYLKGVDVHSDPAHLINQVHYDDAAELCFLALVANKKALGYSIFNGTDGSPTRRGDIPRIAKEVGRLEGTLPTFHQAASDDGVSGVGKVLSNTRACTHLGWSPLYNSFYEFMHHFGRGEAEEWCASDHYISG